MNISVIICCYNPDIDKLKRTITSVMNQEKINFETIITDDGSNIDYYAEIHDFIVENYGERDVIFNRLKKNSGTVINIINGLSLCKTKYYKVISPGDYFYDQFSLKRYYDVLNSNNYDLVFSDAIFYNADKIIKPRKYPTTSLVFNDIILQKYYYVYNYLFLGATIAGRTSVVLEILKKIEGKIIYIEDMSATILLLLEGKRIHGIDEPLMWYEYDTGVSSTTEGCSRLDRDIQELACFISDNYCGRLVDKIRFCKKEKHTTLRKSLLFPDIILARILRYIFRPKKYNVCIDKRNDIIRVQNKEKL